MKTESNIFSIIIVILLIILIFWKRDTSSLQEPIVIRDTVWMKFDSIVITKPQIINRIYKENYHHHYTPDSTYEGLTNQFKEIVKEYLSINVHSDTLKIKDLGYIHITDSVSRNEIQSRKWDYSFKYPEITTTIIKPQPPANQLYIGGGVQSGPVDAAKIGLLFKNKRDNIFKVSAGMTQLLQFQYDAEIYFKLKF